MKKASVKTIQILEASVLGTMAFKNGIKRVPYLDSELLKMPPFKNKIGEKVKGEATSIEIMKAWVDAWDNANLANAWDNCNFSNKLQAFSQAMKQE